MNFGDTMKTAYSTIVYDYLIANGILDEFLYNCEHSSNMNSKHGCWSEPINYAIIWADTPEGQRFWEDHNRTLERKLYSVNSDDITIGELIEQLRTMQQYQQTSQPYEFW